MEGWTPFKHRSRAISLFEIAVKVFAVALDLHPLDERYDRGEEAVRGDDGRLCVPREVLAHHVGWKTEFVYSGIPELATWRLTRGSEVRFVKLAVEGWVPSFADERDRLEWTAAHLPVPEVLDDGEEDGVQWLLLSGLPGRDATLHDLRGDPATLVPILAEGLRAFHEAPTAACPFDFRLHPALELVRHRVEAGLVVPETDFHDEHRHFSPRSALHHLESHRPPSEDVAVCHGDYCLPNVLLDDGGRITGYVDLGELGVADRWWDVAVATWSVTWNLGPGWEQLFLEAYGIELDPERNAYYRLLYDLAS